MTISEVTSERYVEAISRHPHIFNTPPFVALNAHKVEAVRYLLFEDGAKVRLALVLGERDGRLLSPFSAPFGGLSANKEQRLETVNEAVELLVLYARQQHKDIRIVLPPQFYEPNLIGYSINALSRMATLSYIDLDYYFTLSRATNYEACLERNARKNLHRALTVGFEFIAIQPTDVNLIRRAYNVIKANRAEHDYRLSMTWQDVADTIRIVRADFFLLCHEGIDVAAAQIFHVADGIAQVIYWGDLRAYSHLRPMNYLAYRIFEHYRREGLRLLDIGPSTQDGEPNYGLCEFKSGIGCDVMPKFVFDIKATI